MSYRIITAGMLALSGSRRERSNCSINDLRWSRPIVHSRTKYWVQHHHYNLGSARRRTARLGSRLRARARAKARLARRALVTSPRQSKVLYVRNAIRSSEKLTDEP